MLSPGQQMKIAPIALCYHLCDSNTNLLGTAQETKRPKSGAPWVDLCEKDSNQLFNTNDQAAIEHLGHL